MVFIAFEAILITFTRCMTIYLKAIFVYNCVYEKSIFCVLLSLLGHCFNQGKVSNEP